MNWRTFDWKSSKAGRLGEILKAGVYKCAFCKGRGLISHKINTLCPVCSGAKEIKVSHFAVICVYCNTTGRSFLNRELICSVCKGAGIIPIENKEIEICDICKGRGRERGSSLPCLLCKGKGVIHKEAKDMVSESFFEEDSLS